MNFVELILQNKLDEAKELIFARLDEIASVRLEEAKPYVVDAMYEEIEVDEEVLEENNTKFYDLDPFYLEHLQRIGYDDKGNLNVDDIIDYK